MSKTLHGITIKSESPDVGKIIDVVTNPEGVATMVTVRWPVMNRVIRRDHVLLIEMQDWFTGPEVGDKCYRVVDRAVPMYGNVVETASFRVNEEGIWNIVHDLLREGRTDSAFLILTDGMNLTPEKALEHVRGTGLVTEQDLAPVAFRMAQDYLNRQPIQPIGFADVLARHVRGRLEVISPEPDPDEERCDCGLPYHSNHHCSYR